MSDVNVAEQMPAGGSPMAPSSGTYGEEAALQRLRSQLPGEGSDTQSQQATPLPPMGGAPPIPPPATGLPRSMFEPTRQPGVPASTPLTPSEPEMTGPPDAVIAALDAVVNDPEAARKYSRTTRLWAQQLLESIRS